MLRIRLQRFGKKKNPVYRIVVTEKASKRDGEPVARLGFYNPKSKELVFNQNEYQAWVGKGAQPTETVLSIAKRTITHNLAEGPYQAKAKPRKEKQDARVQLLANKRKKKNKKAEAAA